MNNSIPTLYKDTADILNTVTGDWGCESACWPLLPGAQHLPAGAGGGVPHESLGGQQVGVSAGEEDWQEGQGSSGQQSTITIYYWENLKTFKSNFKLISSFFLEFPSNFVVQ